MIYNLTHPLDSYIDGSGGVIGTVTSASESHKQDSQALLPQANEMHVLLIQEESLQASDAQAFCSQTGPLEPHPPLMVNNSSTDKLSNC
jgi:hypothetical protein